MPSACQGNDADLSCAAPRTRGLPRMRFMMRKSGRPDLRTPARYRDAVSSLARGADVSGKGVVA